ncbi:MAG: flavodoxin family protein [Anaerolineae bacterium]|nr:flavodoxin family protein [Anaerolineae bacterium]
MSAKEPIRILGIIGSPRRGGNTEVLVDEVLAGAAEAGALTEKVRLDELDIAPCQACDSCAGGGECIYHDDMVYVLEQMARSQVWILGTPVYWWGPTAQFKVFLDRWYGAGRAMFRHRRVILAVALGGSAHDARHTVGMLTDAAHYLNMQVVATLLAPGTDRPGDVRAQTQLLAEARRAGREATTQ